MLQRQFVEWSDFGRIGADRETAGSTPMNLFYNVANRRKRGKIRRFSCARRKFQIN